MKLFVDTGNLKEIESLVPLGIIDGITTNPSLLAKETGDYREILKKICQTSKGPSSAEVVATDYAGHDSRGARPRHASTSTSSSRCRSRRTASRPARRCRPKARSVNVTLIFSPTQALARREGRRDLRQPVRRPPRRHRDHRDEPDSARSSTSSRTTSSRPKCWSPASAIRFTSSKRRGWAPTS